MKLKSWIRKIKRHCKSNRDIDYMNALYKRGCAYEKYARNYVEKNLPKEKYIINHYNFIIDSFFRQNNLPHMYFRNVKYAKQKLEYIQKIFESFTFGVDAVRYNIEHEYPDNRKRNIYDFDTCKFVEVFNAFKQRYIGYIVSHTKPYHFIGKFMEVETGAFVDLNICNNTYYVKPFYEENEIMRMINRYSQDSLKENKTFEMVSAEYKIMISDLERQMTFKKSEEEQ